MHGWHTNRRDRNDESIFQADCSLLVELVDLGIRVNHKRVGSLMREAGIKGVSRRRGFVITTHRNKCDRPAADLVQRHLVRVSVLGRGHRCI